MSALALESDSRCARAPRFVANLSEFSAVNCVCDLRAETFDVKLLDPRANFFIRSKSYGKGPMFDLWILLQGVDHRHDFGNARFVIGTEQSCSIRGNDVVTDQPFQDRVLLH